MIQEQWQVEVLQTVGGRMPTSSLQGCTRSAFAKLLPVTAPEIENKYE